MSRPMRSLRTFLTMAAVIASLQEAGAQQFQPLGKTIFKVIKAKNPKDVPTRTLNLNGENIDVFYTKVGGKVTGMAFVQKGIYPPNCTHTWVMGVNPSTFKITAIEVIEMSCPHAFPTKSKAYLGQFIGKGPADIEKVKKSVHIAKATGSSDLTKEAVVKTITLAKQNAGSL